MVEASAARISLDDDVLTLGCGQADGGQWEQSVQGVARAAVGLEWLDPDHYYEDDKVGGYTLRACVGAICLSRLDGQICVNRRSLRAEEIRVETVRKGKYQLVEYYDA